MALPERPVVAVVGDGAAIYQIQAVWSAKRYRAGPLYVVLANGGYTVMDRLAEHAGGSGPWPGFEDLELASIARSFGCPAVRVTTHEELVATLDEVVPTLAERDEPLLLDVAIAPTRTFRP
jgi:benzoylformate decarboxylase